MRDTITYEVVISEGQTKTVTVRPRSALVPVQSMR